MLNKKGQVAEYVDLIGGVVILVIGMIIFSVLNQSLDLFYSDQKEAEVNIFESESQNMFLMTIASDEYFQETILTYLQEGAYPPIATTDFMGHRNSCSYETRLDFRERYGFSDLWKISIVDETAPRGYKEVFDCGEDWNKGQPTETIYIPAYNSDKPLVMELYLK